MSDQENLDIGKVVGLIMENPQLIEQISALARGRDKSAEADGEKQVDIDSPESEATQAVAEPTYRGDSERMNRAHLLGALKPYVSKERAKAIDSMISIADILDVMRSR